MSKKIIREVKAMLKRGATLQEALPEAGISYNKWRAICDEAGVVVAVPRGRKARTYTVERVREVKKRIRNGEFLRDICADMKMDTKNLARFCRNNGIILFSKAALKANYARRNYNSINSPRIKRSCKRIERVEAMLKRGLSTEKIATKVGISGSYVCHIRRKMAGK